MVLGHHPKLDGLRAIAILMVLEWHFTTRLHLGALGVRMFFVLSGYLISRIIFNYADQGIPIGSTAAEFYWRRILRLAPPLYLAIAVTAILNVADMRQDWPWHAFYLTNVQVFVNGAFGPVVHFWSLSVEEQFYLIWFFALMATPARYAMTLIISGFFIGVAFKATAAFIGQPFAALLLPGAFDYFCLGALIAYAELFNVALDKVLRRWFGNPWTVGVAAAAIALTLLPPRTTLGDILNDTCEALLSFCLVIASRTGSQGWYLNWFSWPIMQHIGKISYGIYVYHQFVRIVLAHYGLDAIMRHSIGGAPLKLSVEVGLSLLSAELSWRLVEKPIQKLKLLVKSEAPFRSGAGFSRDDLIGKPLMLESRVNENLWHRCRTPFWPRRTVDANWTTGLRAGQVWRRKIDGGWEYKEAPKTADDLVTRQ